MQYYCEWRNLVSYDKERPLAFFYLVGGGGVPVQGVLPHCLTVTMGAGAGARTGAGAGAGAGARTGVDDTTGWGTNGVGL